MASPLPLPVRCVSAIAPQFVGIVALSLAVACIHPADSAARASRVQVLWSAGMETGNLSEWRRGTDVRPDHDSGACYRPPKGVSSRHAHKGKYSMKLTINTKSGTAGCRQNRDVEARSGNTFVYSAWYYLPRREVPTRDMWNVFQFKSDSPSVVSIGTDPFWTINIVQGRRGGPLRLVLKWKGGLTDHTQGVSGPSPIRRYRRECTVRAAGLSQFGAGSK